MDGLDQFGDWDDVARSEETIPLDAEAFETVRENIEGGDDRWVGAFVRDGDGRIVLVQNRWSDGWVLPGGDVERDESLREAVVREVREETGLEATVEQPLEVVEQTFAWDGATASGQFVVFEAQCGDTSLGDDLGRDHDEIADAMWFDSVPEACEHRSLVARYFRTR